MLQLYAAAPVFFRAPAVLLGFLFFWGLNITVFNAFGINYASVLDMSPDENLHPSGVFRCVFVLGGLLLASFYVYSTYTEEHQLLVDVAPVSFYCVAFYLMLTPRHLYYAKSRFYFLGVMMKVFLPDTTKGVRVSFAEVLITDGLTSLAKVFADMEIIVCFVVAHIRRQDIFDATPGCMHSFVLPLVISLPFFLRCRQCVMEYRATHLGKDLANFCKYATAFPSIWSAFLLKLYPEGPHTESIRQIWLLFSAINTMYSYYWDLVWDWGLFDRSCSKFPFRDNSMFPRIWYIVAMIIDLALRWVWSLQLSHLVHLSSNELTLLFEVLEIMRRAMWNLFRVEYEYAKTHDLQGILKQ